jgi:predicted ester cyclase
MRSLQVIYHKEQQGAQVMTVEENKAVIRRYFDEMNRGNLDVLDEVFAASYVSTPLWPEPRYPKGITATNEHERIRQGAAMFRTALPDATTTIEAMTAEGDTVMVCTTTRGTHSGGAFLGVPPTGKQLHWTSFGIYRLANGTILEDRWLWDRLGVWQQLGVLPDQDALNQRRTQG